MPNSLIDDNYKHYGKGRIAMGNGRIAMRPYWVGYPVFPVF